MGRCSYIGAKSIVFANVGRYCSIASDVVTVSGKHPTKEWVTTHPAFFSTAKQCGKTYVSERIAKAVAHIVYLDKDDLSDLLRAAFAVSSITASNQMFYGATPEKDSLTAPPAHGKATV